MGVHNFKMVCAGVVLKAVGIIPSQYVMLAVISDVLDHLEAKNGFRSDGFTMSIYGSIMVGLLGLAVGIVSGLLGMTGYECTDLCLSGNGYTDLYCVDLPPVEDGR